MPTHSTLDVWLHGAMVGQLHKSSSNVEFIYDEAYSQTAGVTPLSLSMPTIMRGHGYRTAGPWIKNLVPEDAEARVRWARRFGESQSDAFTLLRHMGLDAPGAVQVVPDGDSPSGKGDYHELSEHDIALRLKEIRGTRRMWVPQGGGDIRFSLPGQQSKFAIARHGDEWLEPTGRAASTHIIKPGMQSLDSSENDDQAAEFITMRAAKKLGLRVADVDILYFDEQPAFVTTRYDRIVSGNSVVRIHQEDLCQVFSVPPSMKYENDGGPSIRNVATLIDKYSSAPVSDKEFFARALAFNLMAAGIDGHAKNYSVLLDRGRVRLAPLYDLISAYPLLSEEALTYKVKMGMKYGKEYRLRGIGGRNLMRAADDFGYSRQQMYVNTIAIANDLPEAFAQSLDEMPKMSVTDRIRSMPDVAERHIKDMLKTIEVEDLHVAPQVKPTGNPKGPEDIWAHGHYRDGVWIEGRYRRASKRS